MQRDYERQATMERQYYQREATEAARSLMEDDDDSYVDAGFNRNTVSMQHSNVQNGYMRNGNSAHDIVDSSDDGGFSDDDDDGIKNVDHGPGDGSSDETGSTVSSVPSASIDFDLVYALHTFLATVEGQANVVKGDQLTLLDDSNSYWWLVRVLNTQKVGYIPAENIETPFERLARLNKHRNVDLTVATHDDHARGANSARAMTRFGSRIPPSMQPHPHVSQHPTQKGTQQALPSPTPTSPMFSRRTSMTNGNGKRVMFTDKTYYEHSGNEESTDPGEEMFDDDDDMEDLSEDEIQIEQQVGQGFDDDSGDEDMDAGDEGDEPSPRTRPTSSATSSSSHSTVVAANQKTGVTVSLVEPTDDELFDPPSPQRDVTPQPIKVRTSSESTSSNTGGALKTRPPNIDVQNANGSVKSAVMVENPASSGRERPTSFSDSLADSPRKITLTPKIARDSTLLSGGELSPDPPTTPSPTSGFNSPKGGQFGHRMGGEMNRDSWAEAASNESHSSYGDDGYKRTSVQQASGGKKLRKVSQTSTASAGSEAGSVEEDKGEKEKKKKSSGIFNSLFKRKEKKPKGSDERASDELIRSTSPASSGGRLSPANLLRGNSPSQQPQQKGSSGFLTEQVRQRQQEEARESLKKMSVGTAREDARNTLEITINGGTKRDSTTLSPTRLTNPPRPLRPGSLVASPGMEVPVLNVLRVFAGDNIDSDATFKTVLLNETTTTSDLVKQSMQRFRLYSQDANVDEYFLTVKELGGDEILLTPDQTPMSIVESLNENIGPTGSLIIPSVKRSSVGSISSIASNLSLNPAITKLGMNDYSDDSAVKLYLNKKKKGESQLLNVDDTAEVETPTSSISAAPSAPTSSLDRENSLSLTARFAVRVVIYKEDLPETMVFDTETQAIIPKEVLVERSPLKARSKDDDESREKIIMFPRNTNVSEVIETSLDRFGIQEGVVDGGDEVEDKPSRYSIPRVRYTLTMTKDGAEETTLIPSHKLLESYTKPPLFRAHDRSSKEFRRRSVDANLILGSPADIQLSDPVFVLRRASRGPKRRSPPPGGFRHEERQGSQDSGPHELGDVPNNGPTRQEIIAAQRAASRANQHAILSAQRNSEKGVDILVPDGTIRSTRPDPKSSKVRYSYIDEDGSELDISQIVESVWENGMRPERPSTVTSVTDSVTSMNSFQSAPSSPISDRETKFNTHGADFEDDEAIETLKKVSVNVDPEDRHHDLSVTTAHKSTSRSIKRKDGDYLEEALSKPRGLLDENLEQRIDRVLAKVKQGKPRSRVASNNSDRSTPTLINRAGSPGQVNGRSSPRSGSRAVEEPLNRQIARSRSQPSRQDSISSDRSASSPTPSTPLTTTTTFTSPDMRNGSSLSNRPRVVYRDDDGVKLMMDLLHAQCSPPKVVTSSTPAEVEFLFGKNVEGQVSPETSQLFQGLSDTFDDLDSRLDALLLRALKMSS